MVAPGSGITEDITETAMRYDDDGFMVSAQYMDMRRFWRAEHRQHTQVCMFSAMSAPSD